jgi:hypothetical protein
MRRGLLKRPSCAWILHSTPPCGDGPIAVIRTNRRGGSVRSTGTRVTVRGHAKRPTALHCGTIAPQQSVGIRKSRAHVARMMALGSPGQADWADIRKHRRSGPPGSTGKADAARGVDWTANMERTWWNATTSSPHHTGARAKPPTSHSFMDLVMTSRLRRIKRSKGPLTRAP